MKTILLMAMLGAGVPVSGFSVGPSNVVITVERIGITARPVLYEAADPGGPWVRTELQPWVYDLFAWSWRCVVARVDGNRFFKVGEE